MSLWWGSKQGGALDLERTPGEQGGQLHRGRRYQGCEPGCAVGDGRGFKGKILELSPGEDLKASCFWMRRRCWRHKNMAAEGGEEEERGREEEESTVRSKGRNN